jgi:hypothetical protein
MINSIIKGFKYLQYLGFEKVKFERKKQDEIYLASNDSINIVQIWNSDMDFDFILNLKNLSDFCVYGMQDFLTKERIEILHKYSDEFTWSHNLSFHIEAYYVRELLFDKITKKLILMPLSNSLKAEPEYYAENAFDNFSEFRKYAYKTEIFKKFKD